MSNPVRIKSVTFKDSGFKVLTLPPSRLDAKPPTRVTLEHAKRQLEGLFEGVDHKPVGVVMVVWDGEYASNCAVLQPNGPEWLPGMLPGILIPDFVRNRLLAQKIISWAIEDVNESMGL